MVGCRIVNAQLGSPATRAHLKMRWRSCYRPPSKAIYPVERPRFVHDVVVAHDLALAGRSTILFRLGLLSHNLSRSMLHGLDRAGERFQNAGRIPAFKSPSTVIEIGTTNESVHGCSRIHIAYLAMASAKTANAMEKAACLRMVIRNGSTAGRLGRQARGLRGSRKPDGSAVQPPSGSVIRV
jgi:hypothetical protein